MNNTIVICGFPGVVGKSKYSSNFSVISDLIIVLDADSTTYRKTNDISNNLFDLTAPSESWAVKYVRDIKHKWEPSESPEYSISLRYILVSSHKEVRDELKRQGVPYIVVVPDKRLKREYLIRYLKRGDNLEFIDKIMDHWDEWLDDIHETEKRVVTLDINEYLSDIL